MEQPNSATPHVSNIEDYEFNSDSTKVLIYTDSAPVWRYNTKGFYYVFDIDKKASKKLNNIISKSEIKNVEDFLDDVDLVFEGASEHTLGKVLDIWVG